MKKGTKYLTEKEFKDIKTLLGLGVKTSHIVTITGRSTAIVGLAKRFDTLDEARKFNTESRRQYKGGHPPRKVERNEPNQYQSNQILQNIADALNNQSTAFNNMADKLDEVLETKRPWINRLKG